MVNGAWYFDLSQKEQRLSCRGARQPGVSSWPEICGRSAIGPDRVLWSIDRTHETRTRRIRP